MFSDDAQSVLLAALLQANNCIIQRVDILQGMMVTRCLIEIINLFPWQRINGYIALLIIESNHP